MGKFNIISTYELHKVGSELSMCDAKDAGRINVLNGAEQHEELAVVSDD